MNYDQKLTALMHLFKISNSKLARGINVDASLVSRWKSGERKISVNSPHIPMLANYFLRLNAYQYQKEYLEKIIAARLPEKQRQDEASRIHVLTDWLVSAELPDPQPDEQPEQLAQSVSLISSITDILENPGRSRPYLPEYPAKPDQSAGAGLDMAEESGQVDVSGNTAAYEVFEGRAGKRQAVLKFLNRILRSETLLDIYLTSEDDVRWLTEDPNFTFIWARMLRQAIEQGHQITLIHVVNRRVNELMNMLNYWIPLHMAGKMLSYYYPRFGERRIRQTLFIIRKQAVIYSQTTAESAGNELTFLYQEPKTVEHFTKLFQVNLAQCRPLFAVYTPQSAQSFFEQYLEFSKKPGAIYSIRHQLNIRLMPKTTIRHYLRRIAGNGAEVQLTSWLETQQQDFFNRLEQESYLDILPLSVLENIQADKHSQLACCELFAEKPVTIGLSDTILWIQQIIDTLRQYDNYELYLSTDIQSLDALRINITYKENISALFAPAFPDKRPAYVIQLNENNILHSLSYYFDDFIQQIPTSLRSKADVIQRLERLLANLNGIPVKR